MDGPSSYRVSILSLDKDVADASIELSISYTFHTLHHRPCLSYSLGQFWKSIKSSMDIF